MSAAAGEASAKLVRMANQIGAFFRTQPHDDAVAGPDHGGQGNRHRRHAGCGDLNARFRHGAGMQAG